MAVVDNGGPLRSPRDLSGSGVLDDAVSGVGLNPAFQPVVSLIDGDVVGFEALTRWPSLNSPSPEAVFARAAATGRTDGLDRMCTDTALVRALSAGLTRNTLLMLNCEPLSAYVDRSLDAHLARAQDELKVIFELTERSLLKDPRALLRKVARLRADGFGIALDDVGAHPDSLAMLDVVCPDVIKLHMHLVQSPPSDDQTRILAAVLAHQERTGAVLLAEGIESEEHREQALALGASLGQGYKFGRPEPLDGQTSVAWQPPPMKHPIQPDSRSPFELVAGKTLVRTARKATMIPFSRHIEAQARYVTDPPMVLTSLQRVEHLSPATMNRYREIAASSPLVAIFGRGLASDLGHGIRGVDLESDDPLNREWTVLILGPHHAAALVARERDVDAATEERDREFDLTITYDRVLVTIVARALLDRIH